MEWNGDGECQCFPVMISYIFEVWEVKEMYCVKQKYSLRRLHAGHDEVGRFEYFSNEN